MSNTIGFTNFRRFMNFPEIELGDITILVGGNNAGKSTLVKAMLLMRDFLKSRIESGFYSENIFKSLDPQFRFDAEHVNVGDFYRAFCRQSPRKEDTMSFTMQIDKFRFVVYIRGERKPGIIPEVTLIAVSDENRNVHFMFDFAKRQMSVRFVYEPETLTNNKVSEFQINERIEDLKDRLSKSKDLEEISNLKLRIEQLEKQAYALQADNPDTDEESVTVDMSFRLGSNIGNLYIPELIRGFAIFSEMGTLGDRCLNSYKEQESIKSFLRGKASIIKAISNELENVINRQTIEYIYAHTVEQTANYANCANSDDYTKKTIHEFYNARISSGDEEFSLIEDWLKEFGVGESFDVIPIMGDSYRVVIFDKENPAITSVTRKGYPGGIDLADKGMGAIQLVILLLRLATLIRKYRGQQLTILLEEPEQNLHPALQSKLADLLYAVNLKYGVRFVVETHSEYLVRKTQVLVADINNKEHDLGSPPFRVHYLPTDGSMPYEMEYREDGKFSSKFGKGFFDEAANLAFKIF